VLIAVPYWTTADEKSTFATAVAAFPGFWLIEANDRFDNKIDGNVRFAFTSTAFWQFKGFQQFDSNPFFEQRFTPFPGDTSKRK
jgi:hypothetical protein